MLRIALLVLAASASAVFAGEQRYEPLAASVQAALSSAVADRASPHLVFASSHEADAWLSSMSSRLARYISDEQTRVDVLTTIQYESKRAGLDPQLVLGVIDTESKFRKHAVSRAGARGYMQVMPLWTAVIGNRDHNLFNLRTNLRYGCVILRHYLDLERGDTERALARYNGSLGTKTTYASQVLRAWRSRWSLNAEPGQVRVLPVRYFDQP
jgi:soluble lytic murein transglycosylase-like protein